jgi:hypothetical protein
MRAQAVNAGFADFFARVQIGVGVLVIGLGVLLAVAAWQLPPSVYPWAVPAPAGQESLIRGLTSLGLVIGGLGLGAPFIVFGQLVLLLLDMRRRLARIDGRLRRAKRSNDRESPQVERLRHRPGLR